MIMFSVSRPVRGVPRRGGCRCSARGYQVVVVLSITVALPYVDVHAVTQQQQRQIGAHINQAGGTRRARASREVRGTLASRCGSTTTVSLADRDVETWICQLIPRHVRIYAESFVFRSTSYFGRRVSGNKTRPRTNFKERSHEMLIIAHPTSDVKSRKSERAILLVNTASERSAFQQVDLPELLMESEVSGDKDRPARATDGVRSLW